MAIVAALVVAVVSSSAGGSAPTTVRGAAGCPFTAYPQGVTGFPGGFTVGPDRQLWFADVLGNIGAFNTQTHTSTEYPLPQGTNIHGLTPGRAGEIWFTALNDEIGRFDIATKQSTIYNLPSGSTPHKIIMGSDGNLWFTELGSSRLGEFDRTTNTVKEYSQGLPSGNHMHGIARGSGHLLWITLQFSDKLAAFDVQKKKFVRFIKFPKNSQPHDLAVSGRTLYVSLQKASKLAIVDAKTGKVKMYKTGLARPQFTDLNHLGPRLVEPAVSPDKRYVWVTTLLANPLVRFDIKHKKVKLISCNNSKGSVEMAVGPDHHLYFTDTDSKQIDQIK